MNTNRTYFVNNFSIQAAASVLNVSVEIIIQLGFVLDKNIPSRFPINSTAFEVLRLLAIEKWNEKIDYTLYYANCNPINCFYTIAKSLHVATVLTTVISLMGGISVILRITIPPIVKLIRYHWNVQEDGRRIGWQGKEHNERRIFNGK